MKKRKAVKRGSTVETDAQKTARLGPSRKIKRFEKGSKKSTRVAVMECGHKRTVDQTARKTMRCRRCRPGAKKHPIVAKKAHAKKPVKTAAKKQPVAMKKNGNGKQPVAATPAAATA